MRVAQRLFTFSLHHSTADPWGGVVSAKIVIIAWLSFCTHLAESIMNAVVASEVGDESQS